MPRRNGAARHERCPGWPASCRGQAATIVGEPGGTITGTDGDDVIVTNAADLTYAKGGDDTVCVTAGTYQPSVDAGAGDDVVDSTAASISASTG